MNLITTLLKLLQTYMELRLVAASWLLTRNIERYCDDNENEISRLRKLGDPDSQLAADRLLARIVRARGIAQSVPAAGPQVATWSEGANTGRGVQPTDGRGVAQPGALPRP